MNIVDDDFIEFMDFLFDSYVPRKILKDYQNPMEYYTDKQFIKRFRFTKLSVINEIFPMIKNSTIENFDLRGCPISPILKLLTALRFYATGSFRGGFPYWLFTKYPNIRLRTIDKDYMREVEKWFEILFEKVTPLMYGNGGPIILVQVENEYGSYSLCDCEYMNNLRELMKSYVKKSALLYTTDGYDKSFLVCGPVENTLTTVDFGPGVKMETAFKALRDRMPVGPLVNSEFYPGWLSHWGEKFPNITSEAVVKTLTDMLEYGVNINFYMFFGGTNFEFTAGADVDNETITIGDKTTNILLSGANVAKRNTIEPDITSYDYNAPLTEAGDPTKKYFAIRAVLERYYPYVKNYTKPNASLKGEYGPVKLKPVLELLGEDGRKTLGVYKPHIEGSILPTFEALKQRAGLVLYEATFDSEGRGQLVVPGIRDRGYVFLDDPVLELLGEDGRKTLGVYKPHIEGSILPTFEALKQRAGLVLYEATFDSEGRGQLVVPGIRDRGYVFLDDEFIGILDRMTGTFKIPIYFKNASLLSILVEHQGRINYGIAFNDFKGIIGDVKIDDETLNGEWKITGFPLTNLINVNVDANHLHHNKIKTPCVFVGQFNWESPNDTYLDMTGWTKGYVWLNGHNLGRYWPILGPQITLFVPGIYFNQYPKENVIKILELEVPSRSGSIKFIKSPIL